MSDPHPGPLPARERGREAVQLAPWRKRSRHDAARTAALAAAAALLLAALATPRDASAQPGDAGAGDAIQTANLIYAGSRSSVCFSDKFLSNLAAETTIRAARKFKPVKLAEAELYDFPFAVMTGEGGFTLTEDERDRLGRYLTRGGFLLASAGCSSKEWDASFRREIATVLPDYELETIPSDHEVFRTVHEIAALKTKRADAELLGLSVGGKLVVIYSPDGLNDTATMQGCCCCGGNEIKNAQQMNANILAYALLQ